MKRIFYIKDVAVSIVVMLMGININAQQDAMFTHYMYNTLAVNPAYAGSRDALTVTGLNRSQWVGFAGAPNTQTITLHTPFKKKNIGLGMSFVNDKIGTGGGIRNTSFFVDFAYTIKTGLKSKLALGLKAGANMFQANLGSLTVNEIDPSFINIRNKPLPNVGFGMYYYRQRFYAGISVPKLIQTDVKNLSAVTNITQRHYFFIMGTVLKLSEQLDFKPTCLVKVTTGAPVEADLTGNLIIRKSLSLGTAYRSGDAVSALIGYQFNEQFYVGYSYDWSFGLKTGKSNAGSHEVMLRYDFFFSNEQKIRTPRYF